MSSARLSNYEQRALSTISKVPRLTSSLVLYAIDVVSLRLVSQNSREERQGDALWQSTTSQQPSKQVYNLFSVTVTGKVGCSTNPSA
jgi:hypothetical protein